MRAMTHTHQFCTDNFLFIVQYIIIIIILVLHSYLIILSFSVMIISSSFNIYYTRIPKIASMNSGTLTCLLVFLTHPAANSVQGPYKFMHEVCFTCMGRSHFPSCSLTVAISYSYFNVKCMPSLLLRPR